MFYGLVSFFNNVLFLWTSLTVTLAWFSQTDTRLSQRESSPYICTFVLINLCCVLRGTIFVKRCSQPLYYLMNGRLSSTIESLIFPFWAQRVRQNKWLTSWTPVMSNSTSWGYKYWTCRTHSRSPDQTWMFSLQLNNLKV